MEEGDGPIELALGRLGAADGEVHGAEGLNRIGTGLGSGFAGARAEQEGCQAGSAAPAQWINPGPPRADGSGRGSATS